ncbi:unnamed protein product [Adineta ricciae]|uniref:Major facilitator superfamily (MFS) profile domain-containing protein n=1 Tax=Adineta ricciae TaxID=249248 RepID=A0A816B7D3_ADIRI|nr:unnamed protein product [Adineta ricciae]
MYPRKYRLADPLNVTQREKLFQSTSSKSRHDRTTAILTPRWWLVLPCLTLIILIQSSDPLLMNDFIIRHYERRYGFDTSPGSQHKDCIKSQRTSSSSQSYWQFYSNDQNHPDYSKVQQDAASFHTKNSIVGLIPASLTFILFGANCDHIGRRPLIILPLIGKIIWYSSMLIIVHRNLSDTWILSARALDSIFGSGGLIMLGALAYVTDCTNTSNRPRAFLLTEAIMFLARIIPVLAIGIWLRYFQYTVPLSVCLSLSVIALIYAIFIQPESIDNVRNMSFFKQLTLIRLKYLINIVTAYTKKRSDNKRQLLLLITIISILIQVAVFGYLSVLSLYLYGQPLCLDALHVGLLSTAQAVLVFLWSTITALINKPFDNSYLPLFMGIFAVIGNLIILAFAKTIWLLYIGVCIGSLTFMIMPILRAKIVKQIEIDEYAIVFIAAGIIETVGHSAVGAAANSIYNATLNFLPGLVFLVFAGIAIISLSILSSLAFVEQKISKNTNAKLMRNRRDTI